MGQTFFLYLYCQSLDAMRAFYSDRLGLSEIFYAEGEALAYKIGTVQFTIFFSSEATITPREWAKQPGWQGGTGLMPSWSIQLEEERFRGAVSRLTASEDDCLLERPKWLGYWSFPVRDPQGHTVELSYAPKEVPGSTEWD